MCEAPANVTAPGKFQDPGMLHSVLLTDLIPNTKYYYKVGLQDGILSDLLSFTSPPRINPESSFSFLVLADQGCPETGWTGFGAPTVAEGLAQEVTNNHARFTHIVGDLSYSDGAAHVYDAWFAMNEGFTSRAPFMVSIGNHEYVHNRGGIGKDPSGVNTDCGYHPRYVNILKYPLFL